MEKTETTDQKPPEVTAEDVASRIAIGHLLMAFEKITALSVEPGDLLVFRFTRHINDQARRNMVKNFDAYLRQHKLSGLFIPTDVELQGVLRKTNQETEISNGGRGERAGEGVAEHPEELAMQPERQGIPLDAGPEDARA